MAIRHTGPDASTMAKLVILTNAGSIEAGAGDWIVWRWRNEGDELLTYNDEEFKRRFVRADH